MLAWGLLRGTTYVSCPDSATFNTGCRVSRDAHACSAIYLLHNYQILTSGSFCLYCYDYQHEVYKNVQQQQT